MRNQNNHLLQQQLLLSLATLKCLIILTPLLLQGQLATAQTPMSCSAESGATCPKLNTTLPFPFVPSPACASGASSFAILGCSASSNPDGPSWPHFMNGTDAPSVIGFPKLLNASKENLTAASGYVNLTWSSTLINKSACESLIPRNQIPHYLPQPINLTSFAHSAFRLTSSNIILLFNCTSPASPLPLTPNSSDCVSYTTECGLVSTNCSQFMNVSQELNLMQLMESSNCENAMFSVAWPSTSVQQWRPGLIQLSWNATLNPWMSSNLKSCEGCLQTNGSCGYNSDDNFQCYCPDNTTSETNCTTAGLMEPPTDETPAVAPHQYDNGLEPSANEAQPHSHSCSKFKCIGTKIGFGAVGFAIALSLFLALFCIHKRNTCFKASVPCSSPHINESWMKKPSFLLRKQDPISAKEMSYQEILHATESFAETHMLGDGGFGAVYKGILADGRKVAVKRLYHDNYRRMEQFYNEIKVLSSLDHPNLVKLFGFCCEDEKELLLVFEYAPEGTVSDHLHGASKPLMSWNLRLRIACETADALSYLHNSVTPPIYHRDVKTTNILLDEGLHAKLADFGLSKFAPLRVTHVSTAPQGTPGYLDPDYHQCYQLTDKSDVYSLGVVLMELISSKLAVDMSRDRGEINLSTLAVMRIKSGRLEELVDPSLGMKKNQCVERSIRRVVELAFQCLHEERDERPSMSRVAETLTDICREYEQKGGDVGEFLPHIHTSTQSTPTVSQLCVSSDHNKPFQHPQDSPRSVFFSSGSSNHSFVVSSG